MTAKKDFLAELTGVDRQTGNWLGTACNLRAWLMALPQWLNDTNMCLLEFWDALLIWYGKKPLGLESTCNGCGKLWHGACNVLQEGLPCILATLGSKTGVDCTFPVGLWTTDKAMSVTNLKSLMVATQLPWLEQLWQLSPLPQTYQTLARMLVVTSFLMASGRQTTPAFSMCSSQILTQSWTCGRNGQWCWNLQIHWTRRRSTCGHLWTNGIISHCWFIQQRECQVAKCGQQRSNLQVFCWQS